MASCSGERELGMGVSIWWSWFKRGFACGLIVGAPPVDGEVAGSWSMGGAGDGVFFGRLLIESFWCNVLSQTGDGGLVGGTEAVVESTPAVGPSSTGAALPVEISDMD